MSAPTRLLLALAALAPLGYAAAGPPAPGGTISCALDPSRRELAVLCSDGKTWTAKSAGLILPPVLRCSEAQQQCCETGFRSLREIQREDLLRVAKGQAPLCHMLTGDILKAEKARPAPDLLSALPEIDDLSPDPAAALPCPKGQAAARGKCHELKALLTAAQPAAVADGNRVLVPEAADTIRRLRDQFDQGGKCPSEALDIAVVTRIHLAAEERAQLLLGEPVDTTALIAQPRAPEGHQPDPGLPVTCGYNATYSQWKQTSFHCRDQHLCFDQSHPDLMHACVGFARQGSEPFFHQVLNCRNIPPCHQATGGQCTGVARLVPLGQGVFLRVLLGPQGLPYYYGLIFSPAHPDMARRREQARELLNDIVRQVRDPREQARLRHMIGPLLPP